MHQQHPAAERLPKSTPAPSLGFALSLGLPTQPPAPWKSPFGARGGGGHLGAGGCPRGAAEPGTDLLQSWAAEAGNQTSPQLPGLLEVQQGWGMAVRKLRLCLLLFLPLISLLELPPVAPEPGLCGLPALRSLPGGGRREQIRRAPWGGGMPQGPQPRGMGTAPAAEGSHPHSAPCQGSGCPPKGTKGWVCPAPPALLAALCQISALGPQNLKSCSWNWPVIRRASPHGKAEFSWGQEHNLLIFLCVFRSIPSCWAPSGCPATQHDARKDVFRASCGDATKAPHGILEAALLTADFLLSSHPSFQHIPPLSCFALPFLPNPSLFCTKGNGSP